MFSYAEKYKKNKKHPEAHLKRIPTCSPLKVFPEFSIPHPQSEVIQCILNPLPNAAVYTVLNVLITQFNQDLSDTNDPTRTIPQRTISLNQAAVQMDLIFNQIATSAVPNDPNLIQLRKEVMQEIVDVAPGMSAHRENNFKEQWSNDFMRMNSFPSGSDLLRELFLMRNAVNPADRRNVVIKESENPIGPYATGIHNTGYAQHTPNGYAPQAGTDAEVAMPGLEYKAFYEAFAAGTNLAMTPMIMAAHEMIHALHYTKGISLAGIPSQNIPAYAPGAADINIDLEELATTMVPNRSTTPNAPASAAFFPSIFEQQHHAQMQALYAINEQSLRTQAGMPLLDTYVNKHSPQQIGAANQNMNQPTMNLYNELEFQKRFLLGYIKIGVVPGMNDSIRVYNFFHAATPNQQLAYRNLALAFAGTDAVYLQRANTLLNSL